MIMLQITLKKSCRTKNQQACARGLGLRKLNSMRLVSDTKENRGMINKINFLLQIIEVLHETK